MGGGIFFLLSLRLLTSKLAVSANPRQFITLRALFFARGNVSIREFWNEGKDERCVTDIRGEKKSFLPWHAHFHCSRIWESGWVEWEQKKRHRIQFWLWQRRRREKVRFFILSLSPFLSFSLLLVWGAGKRNVWWDCTRRKRFFSEMRKKTFSKIERGRLMHWVPSPPPHGRFGPPAKWKREEECSPLPSTSS